MAVDVDKILDLGPAERIVLKHVLPNIDTLQISFFNSYNLTPLHDSLRRSLAVEPKTALK